MAERATTVIALLAAGAARRFGGGKLDADCAGRRVGAWAAAAVEGVADAMRIAIVPPARPAFVDALRGWEIVTNPDPDRGLSSSVALAARAAAGGSAARLVIALADMPLVPAAHLAALADAPGIAFTRYPDGSRGVPAAFPARHFAGLQWIDDGGAADRDWGEPAVQMAPPDPHALRDVDTPTDLAEIAQTLTR